MKKYIWRGVLIILALYLALVIVRMFQIYNQRKTDAEVAKIQATRLTLPDVMGDNLPPALAKDAAGRPGYDDTIQGLDENKNGIRDDVELAIFAAYPKSARTRAVLLQYALALQLEVVQPIINTDTVTAVAMEEERADSCLADTLVPRKSPESSRSFSDVNRIDSYVKFVEGKQLNTAIRKSAQNDFYKLLGSHTVPRSSCDIEISSLSN